LTERSQIKKKSHRTLVCRHHLESLLLMEFKPNLTGFVKFELNITTCAKGEVHFDFGDGLKFHIHIILLLQLKHSIQQSHADLPAIRPKS